jgi:hypothetical protein
MVYLSRMVLPFRALRNITFATLAAAVGALAVAGSGLCAGSKTTLVELYTSQGCSSCPAADKFLGELAKRPDIVPLSFHVDYWDYIGWKDPFAQPAFSKRQRASSKKFKRGYVFTPQMIVQGSFDATGSDRAQVEEAILKAKHATNVDVAIEKIKDGGMVIAVGSGQGGAAGVWLVFFDGVHVTKVKRGENRGRVVRNYNVVRSLDRVGDWRGDALSIPVSKEQVSRKARGRDGGAVFLQSDANGPILGVAAFGLGKPN